MEILVLRHEVAILRRPDPRPKVTCVDGELLSALLPVDLRRLRLVSPTTLLRWYAQLVAGCWTYRDDKPAVRPQHSGPSWRRFLAAHPHRSSPSLRACRNRLPVDQFWHHSRVHRLYALARWSGDAVGLAQAHLIVLTYCQPDRR